MSALAKIRAIVRANQALFGRGVVADELIGAIGVATITVWAIVVVGAALLEFGR